MYNSPPTLELKTENGNHNFMNIGIRQIEPISGLTIQILRMWATPDSNTENRINYQLVTDQCPETVGQFSGENYKKIKKVQENQKLKHFYLEFKIEITVRK